MLAFPDVTLEDQMFAEKAFGFLPRYQKCSEQVKIHFINCKNLNSIRKFFVKKKKIILTVLYYTDYKV